MAKSLRSKSKLRARTVKRTSSTSSYKQAEEARMHAISIRLARRRKLPTVAEEKEAREARKEERERRRKELGEEVDSEAEEKAFARVVDEEMDEEEEVEGHGAVASQEGGSEPASMAVDGSATPKISTSGPRSGKHQAGKARRSVSTFAINGKAGRGDGKRKHKSSAPSTKKQSTHRAPLRGPGVVGGRRKGK